MESSTKIPPVPLNFLPEIPEYGGHENIVLTAGLSEDEPMWKDPDVMDAKSEISDYFKGLSNWPMMVIGDSCSGKTSILAQACRDLRREQPFDHILFHSVGGAPDSTELTFLLFRLIEELTKRFEIRFRPADLNLDTLIASFPTVLLKAEIDSTLILAIDNIDRLTKDGEPYLDLDWFPRTFPSRCRLILSCGEGKLLNNIRRNRLQFDGSVEFHEIMLPRIQIRLKTPKPARSIDDEGNEGESKDGSR